MTDGATGSHPRVRHLPIQASRGFRVLASITTIATYLEIVLGGTVRATGSGEACPDWPTCQGSAIPSFSEHVLIEYSHRLTASLVSILVVALAITAFTLWRQPRYLKRLCAIAVGLLVLQVLLGGVTVLAKLPPQIVTAHLATATALLGIVTTVTVYSFTGRSTTRDPVARRFSRAAMLAAGATFLLILSGSYVVGSNAGLACHTWPLCNGQIIPTGGHTAVDINFFHRVMATLIGLCIIALVLRGVSIRRGRPALLQVSLVALAVYLLQVVVGAGNVWFGLAASIRVTHLAVAQALWLVMAVVTVVAPNIGGKPVAEPAAATRGRRLPAAPSPDRRARFGDRVRQGGDSAEGRRQ